MTYSKKHMELQKEIHARRAEYGGAGNIWAKTVIDVANSIGTKNILDYGAGKQGLAKSVPVLDIKSYDPAFDDISGTPEPADLVVCTHVLPYVEKEYLKDVIQDLKRVTIKVLMTVINTSKSQKLLESGESVTQIQRPTMEWLQDLNEFFDLQTFNRVNDHEFLAVWLPKSS